VNGQAAQDDGASDGRNSTLTVARLALYNGPNRHAVQSAPTILRDLPSAAALHLHHTVAPHSL
jgi:hypothetical protein